MKTTHLTLFVSAVASAALAMVACSSGEDLQAADEAALTSDAAATLDGGDGGLDAAADGAAVIDGSADGAAPVTFATVEPILAAKCSSCHHSDFATLAGVKAKRADMISKISAGKMPKNEPDWRNSPDGILVLNWLQTSPELQ